MPNVGAGTAATVAAASAASATAIAAAAAGSKSNSSSSTAHDNLGSGGSSIRGGCDRGSFRGSALFEKIFLPTGSVNFFFQLFLYQRYPCQVFTLCTWYNNGKMLGFEPELVRPQTGVLPMSYTHP